MNTTRSSTLVLEVLGYAELQREIHDALRAQHPEWIEADGKSPTCDYYESLFAALLVSHRAHTVMNPDNCMLEMERVIAEARRNNQPAYLMPRTPGAYRTVLVPRGSTKPEWLSIK